MKTYKLFNLLLLIAVIFFTGCGIQSHVQKTPGVDLQSYKTYSFIPADDSSAKGHKYKNFEESFLKRSIAAELEKKGLRESDVNPDILVEYDVQVEKDEYTRSQPVYSTPYMGYRYNPYTGRIRQVYYPSRYLGSDYYTVPYKSGTITVNIVDTKSNEVAWQGWAQTEVDKKKLSADEMSGIVKAIFKKYRQ